MNPVRSLVLAVVSGEVAALWLYVLAPLVGAAAGTLAYQLIRGDARA